jgi:hypothetical protein
MAQTKKQKQKEMKVLPTILSKISSQLMSLKDSAILTSIKILWYLGKNVIFVETDYYMNVQW